MGKTSTNRPAIPAVDALDRWLTNRRGAAAPAPAESSSPVVSHAPNATEAGRAIVEALAAAPAPTSPPTPAAPVAAPAATKTSTHVPQPELSSPRTLGAAAGAAPSEVQPPKGVATPPHATPAAVTVPASAAAEDDVADVITFAPKHGARRVLGVALATSALVTVGAGLLAWRSGTDTAYAVVVAAAAVTVVVWALFGRSTTTKVSIHHGQLRVVQGASQHRFPLTATYPAIDVLGAPGDRGWKVLVQRKGMGPYEITPSMVDPAEFTAALRRFRPDA